MTETVSDRDTLVRLRVTGLNIETDDEGDKLVATLRFPDGRVQTLSPWAWAGFTNLETVRVRVPSSVEVRLGDEFAFVRLPPADDRT